MKSLSQSLWEFKISKIQTDFVIYCRNGPIKLHKIIYFKYLDLKKTNHEDLKFQNDFDMQKYSKEEVDILLESLYYNNFNIIRYVDNINLIAEDLLIDLSLLENYQNPSSSSDEIEPNFISYPDIIVPEFENELNIDFQSQSEDSENVYPDFSTYSEEENQVDNNTHLSIKSPYNRGPYKKYLDCHEFIEHIFNQFNNNPNLSQLSRKYFVPRTTLSTWKINFESDPTWRPSRKHYSDSKKFIPAQLEFKIAKYLRKKNISQSIIINRAQAIEIIKKYLTKLIQKNKIPESFMNINLTQKWLKGFLKRNKLTFRCLRPKKRSNIDEEKINLYLKQVKMAIEKFGPEKVINIDETQWLITQPPKKNLAIIGSEVVNGKIGSNLKSGFTVIAGVTASGKKIPLTILAKGKKDSTNFKNYYDPDFNNIIIPSISGWSTINSMREYFTWLVSFQLDEKFVVILDQYPAHLNIVKELQASNTSIEFIFIPPGATDLLQPLDRVVFGVLKSKGKKKWNEMFYDKEFKDPSRLDAVKNLNLSWNEISERVIKKGWDYSNIRFQQEEEEILTENDEYIPIFSEPQSSI